MFPNSAERVAAQTGHEVNRRIRAQIEASVRRHAARPRSIDRRLRELDREWDIERVLEANAASLTLGGVALAAGIDRRWLALPALVSGFLLQHALQGWCPPLPILRRLGFRTAREIDEERFALKALRGDFGRVEDGRGAHARAARALAGARR